jgi:hypothetical protein
MTMEQFAKSLSEQENASPLLRALQDLRWWEPDQLREQGYFCEWLPWPPMNHPAKPEIIN